MESSENKLPALLRVEGLGYQVDGQVLFSDINFEISAGERIAIFGPSGAGKSTKI